MQFYKMSFVLLSTWSLVVHAENFIAKFPVYSADQSIQIKKIESLGTARLNKGVEMLMYTASIDNPYGGGGLLKDEQSCKKDRCRFNYTPSKQNQSQFKIITFPSLGSVLIPKQWNTFQFDMGASSVASVNIYSPQFDQVIHIENTASCGGCSMLKASLYFPDIKKLSLKIEFGAIEDKNHTLNIIKANKNKVYFSYQIPNYPNKTHGIAFYADESNGYGYTNFQEIKVTLKPEYQSWAREILNFYQATH